VGAVTSDRPLGRIELDKLLSNLVPEPGQPLVLGCPQCLKPTVNVGYTDGLLIIACESCKLRLALIQVAGGEHAMLGQALEELAAIRSLVTQQNGPSQ
jgi:hypothetical protein